MYSIRRSQIFTFLIFVVLFSSPLEKVVIDKEELPGIEIDGILNLENLSRTVFID